MCDNLQHAVSITQNFRIPEAKNPVSLCDEPTIAACIGFAFVMLSAIKLNHQLTLVAYKIDDERPNGCLAPKTDASKTVSAQPIPKALLCLGHLVT